MNNRDEIINRVATSSLINFDLEKYYQQGDRIGIDMKDQLFQGLILREKDLRDFIKSNNWSQYQNKFVAIYCSVDAIIPTWAYMLLAIALKPFAKEIVVGSLEDLEIALFKKALSPIDWSQFKDTKVVVKGCSSVVVPISIYVEVAAQLQPIVSSLMFGEPCSTVPLYKRQKM